MKRILYSLATACLMAVLMTSCNMFTAPSFEEDLLIGKWQNTANSGEFWVYTTETTNDGEYQYGHTWDESYNDPEQAVYEEDLTPYGNGWFKWKLVKSSLTQIHLMENAGAEIPKVYTVTALTETTLTYKDDFKKTYTFKKISK
ncbi:MAG: hypothetical protein IJV55_07680 [Paludibacteraceae bacterium]|nr:hypothetical protein [Paludibacteraceae bacterium]MBQ9706047.1 hypothetical protein [Paludibacteraceae bacterium]